MRSAHKSMAVLLAASLLAVLGAAWVIAQEHPEHPEHPEHSAGSHAGEGAQKTPVTNQTLSKAIRDWVDHDAKLKGGMFTVYDPVNKKPLAMTVSKVHDDKLASLSKTLHFACADFNANDGKVYDLDVFMEGGHTEDLKVTEVTVHKEEGKPRYNWKEEGGFWKKVPLEEKAAK